MENAYLNLDALKNDILELIDEVADEFKDEQYYEYLHIADEMEREWLAELHANKINDDMNTYMHRDDTSIVGNFSDIRYDYERDHKGMYFKDMVERLDKGLTDELTNADRDWVTSWFWNAFGTWGFKYNLECDTNEELASLELEMENENI